MSIPVINSCEQAVALVQECLAAMPVIILGSGHSAAFGLPGMDELRDHLERAVPPRLPFADTATWEQFKKAVRQKPLEAALHDVHLSSELMDIVVEETWKCCLPHDQRVLQDLVRNCCDFPLARLFGHLFRSTHLRLSVVTTNYDRIAEYASDAAGFGWSTGFGQGYIGHRHMGRKLTIQKDGAPIRMVDIWKVHGSLDWFWSADGTMYSLPACTTPPDGFTPLMVVPGGDKYRRAFDEPFRSGISGADQAIRSGNSFLCIGYGFNDEHVQPPLLERCRRQQKPIIVLTKQLTPAAKTVLLDGRCRRFAAFEETSCGTRMFSPDHPAGVDINGVNLWSLGQCLDSVI